MNGANGSKQKLRKSVEYLRSKPEVYLIHITGRVQGVGFRPFICSLATSQGLNGTVKNTSGGVYIEVAAGEQTTKDFIRAIHNKAPVNAIIETVSFHRSKDRQFSDFRIIESERTEDPDMKISPDYSLCASCKADMIDSENKRYNYAFTTCSECGPRFSIQNAIPYDRQNTTMASFVPCESCGSEYKNPVDQRFYSQTNSCPECGVSLQIYDKKEAWDELPQDAIVNKTVQLLQDGNIVAVKGIGGYLLMCDPGNRSAIMLLRERKKRPQKPFALLYPTIEQLKEDAIISENHIEWLQNEVSPIVLLERKKETQSSICWEQVTPLLQTVGVMLPYAPLLAMIIGQFGQPLIATSGNMSGGVIIFEDKIAKKELLEIADYVLTNNRDILVPQDDSILRFAVDQPIWLRRSRGVAPSYFGPKPDKQEEGTLALGAHMKASFAWSQSNNWHVSQYLGSLNSFESQVSYEKTLHHVINLFQKPIQRILSDKHPGYFTHILANEYVNQHIPASFIQHHEAHFAAILQEHDLFQGKVLGVIWDGAGYGDDQQIWGGEFFKYHNYDIQRIRHFSYSPVIANEKMANEPRLSALSFTHELENATEFLRDKFTYHEWKNYLKYLDQPNISTSSMGRLFDAVSSLLGLIDCATYEGQAAMLLEEEARKCQDEIISFYRLATDKTCISTMPLFKGIIDDLNHGKSKAYISKKFHLSLVAVIDAVASNQGYDKIAFSGGTFQNAFLVSLIKLSLSSRFQLYFHVHLPPNDENISFGQLAYHHMHLMQKEFITKQQSLCV